MQCLASKSSVSIHVAVPAVMVMILVSVRVLLLLLLPRVFDLGFNDNLLQESSGMLLLSLGAFFLLKITTINIY